MCPGSHCYCFLTQLLATMALKREWLVVGAMHSKHLHILPNLLVAFVTCSVTETNALALRPHLLIVFMTTGRVAL